MREIYVTCKDDLQYILDKSEDYTTIYLAEGVYRGKFKITKKGTKIVGANRETTVISFDDYAKKKHADGREYNTFRTYTLMVAADGVTLENLTVENTNDNPKKVGQCVALSVNADDFTAKKVDLKSTQDTLFCAPFPDDLVIRYSGLTDDKTYYDGFVPRDELYFEGSAVQVFYDCRIYGTVDFIFGCAEAYFLNCSLISLYEERGFGFVAAPAHSLKQTRGFTFYDCDFKSEGANEGTVFLARPWRDFGKCDFISCRLGNHLSGELFDKWNDTFRNKTARFGFFALTPADRFKPNPVDWAKQLPPAQAEKIIADCREKIAKLYK